ncbi:MAG: hypothetical protein GY803_12355 [Chloroflexi bacterium]|nr:hypothetical protein [Chloroflexota bacterium]
MTDPIDLDELQYDWPPNVLAFDTKFIFGLTMIEMLVVAGVGLGLLRLGLGVGLLGGGLALLLVKEYEALGGRRVPEYFLAWFLYRFAQKTVILPDILPAAEMEVIVRDLEGREIMRIGGAQ